MSDEVDYDIKKYAEELHPHNECEDCNIFLGGSNAYTIHCLNNNHGVLYCACEDCV
jgi:hypothetical protein